MDTLSSLECGSIYRTREIIGFPIGKANVVVTGSDGENADLRIKIEVSGHIVMKLFENINARLDDKYLIKNFFNNRYREGRFLLALEAVLVKENIVIDEEYCLFPDFESPDQELHFVGVKIGSPSGELIVSEILFSDFIHEAHTRYVTARAREATAIKKVFKKILSLRII